MLLEIKDLRVFYGKAEILKGISMIMNEKEIVGLLGANGVGKTTTLRTISGLKAKGSGEIWFCNGRIDSLRPHKIVMLGIAHVPEGRRVFEDMNILDNLRMGAYLRKDKQAIIKDVEYVYNYFPILKERRRQQAGSLSGGEQQMLAIARALMNGPKLILMDEPSMGLSPLLVLEVSRIIRDINNDGVGIILVEQNSRMALKLADRGYVMEGGKIVLEGSSTTLMENSLVKEAYLGG